MYYLYRHIRLDKNEVFYIGIGTIPTGSSLKNLGSTHRALYYRAYEKKKSRNSHWKNIISKSDYKVDILFETDNINIIIEKEIEFISLYKDTLCNQTSGGLGITSYKHTEETKASIKNSLTGRKRPKEIIDKINEAKCKSVIMFNDDIEIKFNSRKDAAIYLGNINYQYNIARAIRTNIKAYGYNFKSAES